MSWFSHPHCQVESRWDSTDLRHRNEETHAPKIRSHEVSSALDVKLLPVLDFSNQKHLVPLKVQFCIVSLGPAQDGSGNPCVSCSCWLFVRHSLFETDSGSMDSGAPPNPSSDGGPLQRQSCYVASLVLVTLGAPSSAKNSSEPSTLG